MPHPAYFVILFTMSTLQLSGLPPMTGPRAFIRLRLLLVLLVVVSLATAAAFAVHSMRLPRVQVTRMTSGPVVQAFYATGTVVPEREYSVRSNVAGILFLEAGIDKGVAVRKDQLLARVVS